MISNNKYYEIASFEKSLEYFTLTKRLIKHSVPQSIKSDLDILTVIFGII